MAYIKGKKEISWFEEMDFLLGELKISQLEPGNLNEVEKCCNF
jgi:hypothetical protein